MNLYPNTVNDSLMNWSEQLNDAVTFQDTELFMSVWIVLTLNVRVTDGVKNKL